MYAVEDADGFWIASGPGPGDRVVFGPASLAECEARLAREIQSGEGHDR